MNELYRAHFVAVADPANRLTVDLVINSHRRWVESLTTAGWWGRLKSDDIWPFVLQQGGQIDFGNDSGNPYTSLVRFARFELSDVIIERGERYNLRYHHDDTYVFELDTLRRVADMVEAVI